MYYPNLGYEILRPQIFFSTFHSRQAYFRSLIGVRLLMDFTKEYNVNRMFQPRLFIKNHITGGFLGPFNLNFISVRDVSIKNLEFPKIMSASYFEDMDNDFIFYDDRFKSVLFLDLDFILKLKKFGDSAHKLLDFELTFRNPTIELSEI